MEAKPHAQIQAEAAKPSIPVEDDLVSIDDKYNKESIVILNECPTVPCQVYYTDALSESLLIICKSPKHKTTPDAYADANTDIEKVVGDG
jgi:hypothetical protein